MRARTAVVLAAGRGTRLGELTRTVPKPLLEVGGRPMLLRILDGFVAAGVEEIAVVTGHLGDAVRAAVGGEHRGARVTWFEQPELDGTAGALALAREYLGEAPFAFGWGDIVVAAANYGAVIEAAATGECIAIAVNEVDDPFEGAAVTVDDAGFVTSLVEKPPRGTSATRWNNAGLGVLDGRIWPAIDALGPSPRGERELPRAIASLIATGVRVRAVPVVGPWFDAGTPESLAAACRAADNGAV